MEHAEPLFNIYRREGHQFDVEVYNQLLFGWAEQVCLPYPCLHLSLSLLSGKLFEDNHTLSYYVR